MKDYELTGEFFHKYSWFGLILYVEIEFQNTYSTPSGRITNRNRKFKRANMIDAHRLKLLQK